MKITADTNVLLRAVVGDDEVQQQMAIETLESAELVAISAHSLCEFAWVLDRGYKTARSDIASVISHVLEMHNVVVNRPAVEAGLRILKAGAISRMGSLPMTATGWVVKPSSHLTRGLFRS